MTGDIIKRLSFGVSAGIALTFITFVLMSFNKEAVARRLLGEHSSIEAVETKVAELGLDEPLLVRFGDWLLGIVKGDFGTSWLMSAPVTEVLQQRLPVTASVVVLSLVLSAIVAVAIGLTAANWGGLAARILDWLAIGGLAVPSFWLAMILVSVFAVRLDFLPATGYVDFSSDPLAWAKSLALPVLALSASMIASISQQIKKAAGETLDAEYVRTLRARGVPNSIILLKNVLRNSSSPALTVMSLQFINVLGGSVVVEKVFALNGIGELVVNAGRGGDQPIVLGVVIVMVFFVVAINFLVDLSNSFLNPKIRLEA